MNGMGPIWINPPWWPDPSVLRAALQTSRHLMCLALQPRVHEIYFDSCHCYPWSMNLNMVVCSASYRMTSLWKPHDFHWYAEEGSVHASHRLHWMHYTLFSFPIMSVWNLNLRMMFCQAFWMWCSSKIWTNKMPLPESVLWMPHRCAALQLDK